LPIRVLGEAHHLKYFDCPPAACGAIHPREAPMQREKLAGCEPLMKAEMLWQETNPRECGDMAWWAPKDERGASGRVDEPKQHLDTGALASAIRPKKAKDLATWRRER
jgi:hypothetical protein